MTTTYHYHQSMATRLIYLALSYLLLATIFIDGSYSAPNSQKSNDLRDHINQNGGDHSDYLIGAGIADITGPAADINLMGYAKPGQDAGGIHLRIYSRSVIIEDKQGNRVLYTSLDNGMISQLLRVEVLKQLKLKYGSTTFNETNVMMSATHTHSAPGGFFQYMLYNIPSAGFISQTLDALVQGIVRSVDRAHDNMKLAKIYFTKGKLYDASVNRSPISYANNPAEERRFYEDDTDKTMYLLRMVDKQTNEPIAMVNWFAVHGTSMNNTNHLISSDNKGLASILFEQELNPQGTLPGKGKFVAIFAQANEGDVSPNTRGPRCIDTGLPCDTLTSTCGNPPRNEKCIASGPGKDMFESTKIIAYKQYFKARQLFMDTKSQKQISGPIKFIHEHIDMTQQVVPPYKSSLDLLNQQKARRLHLARHLNDTTPYTTCTAALGYSFAAGTTDGPGAFDFQQGHTLSNRYWNLVRDFLRRPSEKSIKCQKPKPIILATGEMDFPYMWHPKIVPTQILMIGQLVIVGLPGEFTTMSGRRIRNAVHDTLKSATEELYTNNDARRSIVSSGSRVAGDQVKSCDIESMACTSQTSDFEVVLSGLSNIYTSYITTIEEYNVQRYEGASTLYGPHTLQAYINQFQKLAHHLVSNQPLGPNALEPPDLTKSLFTIKAGVIFDGAPRGKTFGSVLEDVNSSRIYQCRELVNVSFVAGNPRNDLKQEESFLYVDKLQAQNNSWLPIASDSSWETKFIWERTSTLYGESRVIIEWEIPTDCESGVYRIRHYGAYKSIFQTVTQYSGKSSPFKVKPPEDSVDINQLESLHRQALELDKVEQQAEEIRKRVSKEKEEEEAAKPKKADHGLMRSLSPMKVLNSWLNWNWG